ncbi:dermonecrotic toxin domain-containing protein [Pseudomonas kitaguniensis]|uniref:dermonecrotic toxin domain-containing protein n=1 Tax=Pseudomonas kitaguniensis TaxID=2607908 RepID=UPI003D0385EF
MHIIPTPSGLSPSGVFTSPDVLNSKSNDPVAPQEVLPTWKNAESYQQFAQLLAKDTAQGAVSADGKELLDAFLNPDPSSPTQVHVRSFAVHGVPSNDMFIIRRKPPVPDKINVMMYMPEQNQKSFHEFPARKDMHKFLKELPDNPVAFPAFLKHFGRDARLESVETVRQLMLEWASAPEKSKPAWVLGEASYIARNIFEVLDEWSNESANTPIVNGLTDIQTKEVNDQGVITYIGWRPTGESVQFRYDMLGNLMGAGETGNIYYLKKDSIGNKPLLQITPDALNASVVEEALKVIRDEGTAGVLKAIGNFLEHPFDWVSRLLEAFGVSKSTSGDAERFIDNPITFLLTFANKYNDLGKSFGKTKAEMDKIITATGDKIQGAVPAYGQIRSLAALIGKAIKNEPLSDEEVKDGAEALGLKP